MKRLAILGSTGSVGRQVLDVIARFPHFYQVVGLAAGHNLELLARQARTFEVSCLCVAEEQGACLLVQMLKGHKAEVMFGQQGLVRLATMPEADLVVGASAGSVALVPLLAALKEGKRLALATKELLVMAGQLLIREATQAGAQILPMDSEASAVFQVLQGHNRREVRRIILTASGGPFWEMPDLSQRYISVEAALSHPRWQMGKKISVDSATFMNKGLEVIETHWLFGIPVEQIEVHVHPESVVHSLVEFKDGTIVAQMAITDMRLPIACALSYPERLEIGLAPLDLVAIGKLTFLKPDQERFPCLKLAYEAARAGGSMPTVLNAANEVAVAAFLNREIKFQDIPGIVGMTMEDHSPSPAGTLEGILAADQWARNCSSRLVEKLRRP